MIRSAWQCGATAALSLALLAHARPAAAQRWEFDVHGGFALGGASTNGTKNTPAAGATFVLADGAQQSRTVSSWFFGDGTALFNQVIQLRGITTRLSALDDSSWPQVGRSSGTHVGGRIVRSIASRLALEAAFALGMNSLGFTKDGLDKIESARSSFTNGFLALNNSSPTLLGNPTITATTAISTSGSQLITTGALVYRGVTTGRVLPYLLIGAGLNTPLGNGLSMTLTGNYKLTSIGQVTINETDTVTLRTTSKRTPVYLLGGGARRRMSAHTALRIDIRLLLN